MRVFAPPGGGGEVVLGGDCGGEDYLGVSTCREKGTLPLFVCVGVGSEIAKYWTCLEISSWSGGRPHHEQLVGRADPRSPST